MLYSVFAASYIIGISDSNILMWLQITHFTHSPCLTLCLNHSMNFRGVIRLSLFIIIFSQQNNIAESYQKIRDTIRLVDFFSAFFRYANTSTFPFYYWLDQLSP